MVEHACSITSLMLGETLPSITKDMDTFTYRLPIGVCAGIAPFNFPAMIPLWMFPLGMVCGNTYLMKPSERVPGCTMLLTKMLQDAGAPDGTVNIIHGQHAGESIVSKQGACKMLHETVLYYTLYTETFEYWVQQENVFFFCVCACVFVCVAVNFICDHPAIQAISFVGSNSAGEYIYERGSKNGKRVQSNMVGASATPGTEDCSWS